MAKDKVNCERGAAPPAPRIQKNNKKKRGPGGAAPWAALFFLFFSFFFPSSASAQAKYVFLFVGDGMGVAMRNSGELFLAGRSRVTGEAWLPRHANLPWRSSQLLMNSLPIQTTVTTRSLSGTTDSAAAASAMATGTRFKNGALALDENGQAHPSIAELAKRAGMRVGIVSTSFLNDATPAAFYAHAASRKEYSEIACQAPASGVDYFAGGSWRMSKEGTTKEQLLALFKQKGYATPSTREAILGAKQQDLPLLATDPAALSSGYMPYADPFAASLPAKGVALREFVRKGIELLKNDSGFFMLVEGGKIDIAAHANDAATVIREILSLDDALAVAVDFYFQNPQETLIVVVSDHETGGMSCDTNANPENFYALMSESKSPYTALEGRIAAFRKNSPSGTWESFTPQVRQFIGERAFSRLQPAALGQLRKAFLLSRAAPNARTKDAEYKRRYGPYEPIAIEAVRERDKLVGIEWTTLYHTDKHVALSILGAGSDRFAAASDARKLALTDIFTFICEAVELQ